MARNVFISFRFSDGADYKEELSDCFDKNKDIINYSEDEDRSNMSEETIKNYLYKKLKETSVTIIILTPEAVNYKKDVWRKYDDWLYDELRYSLEDREDNRTNAVVAVYTKDAAQHLYTETTHKCSVCNKDSRVKSMKEFDNLVRKNMMNIKISKKKNQCDGIYDSLEDSYCSLIEFDEFKNNIDTYIDNAIDKRNRKEDFDIVKRM